MSARALEAMADVAAMMLQYARTGDAALSSELILRMDDAERARCLLAAVQIGGTLIQREAGAVSEAEHPVTDYLVRFAKHTQSQ